MQQHKKLVEKLLKKANQNLVVLEKWRTDIDIAVEILGFHAQQAAEKLLKVVLAFKGVDFPFIHRLSDLLDLIKAQGIEIPEELDDIRFLTPFAVEFRYDPYEEDEEPVDFEKEYDLLTRLREWVKAIIHFEEPNQKISEKDPSDQSTQE